MFMILLRDVDGGGDGLGILRIGGSLRRGGGCMQCCRRSCVVIWDILTLCKGRLPQGESLNAIGGIPHDDLRIFGNLHVQRRDDDRDRKEKHNGGHLGL